MATVLVVDDDAAIREFVAEALADEGYAVHEARDGREAHDVGVEIHRDRGHATRREALGHRPPVRADLQRASHAGAQQPRDDRVRFIRRLKGAVAVDNRAPASVPVWVMLVTSDFRRGSTRQGSAVPPRSGVPPYRLNLWRPLRTKRMPVRAARSGGRGRQSPRARR